MLQFSKLFGIRKTAIAALAIVAMLGALISINPASADYYPAYSAQHLLTVEVDADEDGVTAVYIYEDYDAGERVWERGDADLDVVTSHGRIEIDKYSVGHVYERNAASGYLYDLLNGNGSCSTTFTVYESRDGAILEQLRLSGECSGTVYMMHYPEGRGPSVNDIDPRFCTDQDGVLHQAAEGEDFYLMDLNCDGVVSDDEFTAFSAPEQTN